MGGPLTTNDSPPGRVEKKNNTKHNLAIEEMDWGATPSIHSNEKQSAASVKENPVAKRQKTLLRFSPSMGPCPSPALSHSYHIMKVKTAILL